MRSTNKNKGIAEREGDGLTGICHESSANIDEAAKWYATLPALVRSKRPAIPLLKERYGLSAVEACQALREAALIRARAL